LFSNGDAHFKNFSLIETKMGDLKLSPAYDLINTSIHINDSVLALEDGLLPKSMGQGKISTQFGKLSEEAGINKQIFDQIFEMMVSKSDQLEQFILASFLDESTKQHYLQTYHGRLNRLIKVT
jgi:serine/threonine-protein kinase HipA